MIESWDETYQEKDRIWGDAPSELARVVVSHLEEGDPGKLDILEIGCGYGRDTAHIASQMDARILGTDPSRVAIDMAKGTCSAANVSFRCCSLGEINSTYDAVRLTRSPM